MTVQSGIDAADESAERRPYRILVVDDERDIREALRGLLEKGIHRVEVFTAESGFKGLDVLREGPIDLIVTDYKMPGMNGLEFLAEASKMAPKAPRVLITAFERELAAEIAGSDAAEHVFTKPLNPRPLIQSLQRLLAAAEGT